jgi:CheY-like chemotaxis protein
MRSSNDLKSYTLTNAWRAVEHVPSRILLADDDADLRQLMADELGEDGSEVIEARDGIDALDRYRGSLESGPSSWFDVIVSDFKMPNLNGLKLLRILRDEWALVPFILMSAFIDSTIQDEARSLGAWTVLKKPIDLEALHLAIRQAI